MSPKKDLNTSLDQFMKDPSSAFVGPLKNKPAKEEVAETPSDVSVEESADESVISAELVEDVTVDTVKHVQRNPPVTVTKQARRSEGRARRQSVPSDFPIHITPTVRKTAPEKSRFQLIINKDVMDRVKAKAAQQGVSVNKVVNDLLAYWVNDR